MELRRWTTLRTGGTPLRYFRPADADGLRRALAECRRDGVQWRVLGGGSNLLVEEGQLSFAVIHIHAPAFGGLARTTSHTMRAGAGVLTGRLLTRSRDERLGGLEFLAGLPGTVGGALAGNAGAWGSEILDRVEHLRVITSDGEDTKLTTDQIQAAYRRCELRGAVVTEAEFRLEPCLPELIARRMAEFALRRAARHPLGEPSAGCIFKNPVGQPAGKLLDLCQMKGQREGGVTVSRRHANFIVNTDHGTADDVLRLIDRMRAAVLGSFDVEMELEVQHWGTRPEAA